MNGKVVGIGIEDLRTLAAQVTRDSQAQFARDNDVSLQYLNDFLRGRRDAGKKLLRALGYEKVVTYRPCKN